MLEAGPAAASCPASISARRATHHMLFKGADGAPYEVRGEAGSVFNILSSPRLSVNSQFVAVPPQFPVCPPANAHAHAPLTPRVWWADAGRGRHCAG